MTKSIVFSCALLSISLSACGDSASSDAGVDGALHIDAGMPDGGPSETDGGRCLAVTAPAWTLVVKDDVSIRYRARIEPEVGGEAWYLNLEFIRYLDAEYVGEFPLGVGADASYGSCPHCVIAFLGLSFGDRAFFASAGTLTVRSDPFEQRLDATLTGVVLEEVMLVGPTLDTVRVPDGRCLTLAETSVSQSFPTAGWRCDAEQFNDGATCNCGCGAIDPDCLPPCTLPPEPGCDPTPLPIEGCRSGDLCTWEGECSATCDHAGRVPCESGICGYWFEGDRCFDPSEVHIDPASIGERCALTDRVYHCAVDPEGFAMGLCDPDGPGWCRQACASDGDCSVEGETCWTIFIDELTGRAQGYCKPPPPPCRETGSTCSDHLDCCSVLCEGLDGREGAEGTCG